MNIRGAHVGDAAVLSEVAVEAVEPHRNVDFTKAGWKGFLFATTAGAIKARLKSHRYACFCAENERQIVGFITIKDGETIDQLFVRPCAQRTGVAKRLWVHARQACLLEKEPVNYWVRSSSVAVPAYRRFGFVEQGGRVNENGVTYQLMKLSGEPKS